MTSLAIAMNVQQQMPPSPKPTISGSNSGNGNNLYYDISSPQNLAAVSSLLNAANLKDSRWLTLEVCRQYQRNACTRDENECKFAHPPSHVDIQYGRVTCCYDSIKGKCQRKDPPCKYLHPPQHLKEQLVQNGRKNLIVKSLQLHFLQQQLMTASNPQIPNATHLSLLANNSSLLDFSSGLDLSTKPSTELLLPNQNSLNLPAQEHVLSSFADVTNAQGQVPLLAMNQLNCLNNFTSTVGGNMINPNAIINSNAGNQSNDFLSQYTSQIRPNTAGAVDGNAQTYHPLPAKRPTLPRECNSNIPPSTAISPEPEASKDIGPGMSTGSISYPNPGSHVGMVPGQMAWIPPNATLGKMSSPLSVDLNLLAAINLVPTDPVFRSPYGFDWGANNYR